MQGIAWFLLTLLIVSALAFRRCKSFIWFSVGVLYLSLLTVFFKVNFFLLSFFWSIFLFISFINFLPSLRKKFIVAVLFKRLQKVIPHISETEKIAIEAGDVWWEKDLFLGKPDFKKLHEIPVAILTAEEFDFINHQVTTLCTMLDSWRIYQDKDLSKKVWQFLKKECFMGLLIPKEFGGLGFSAAAHSLIIAKIASRNDSAAVTAMVPNSLGPAELILLYGTDQQKKDYLPKLASGKMIPCFALTSLEAGSDAAAITDSGIICYGDWHGERVLGLSLTWHKRYITLAPVADLLALAVKVFDPDKLIGENASLGITVCLVPIKHPGVQVGRRHRPLAASFMNGPTQGEQVFIPLDWVIGGQEKIGHGWQMLMECLSRGRGISLPAMATGISMLACRTTTAYAKIRKQFNLSIGQFGGVESLLARMTGLTYMMEAMRLFMVSAVSQGIGPAVSSAMAKYQSTEMGREVIQHAMDVHGGKAIQLGAKNYLGLLSMNAPIGVTVEGANVLTRHLIIFGQGVLRCHPYLLAEIHAVQNNDLNQFNQLIIQHAGRVVNVLFSTFLLTMTRAKIIRFGSKSLQIYYQQLMRMSNAFALTTEFALLFVGAALKQKERLSARLADIWRYLCLVSAILKWYADQRYPKEQLPLIQWSMDYCFYQIQIAFDEFLQNFPAKKPAWFLKKLIFPFGQIYFPPADQLEHQIIEKMLEPGILRDIVTKHCFIHPDDNEDAVKQLEITFEKMVKAEFIYKKLRQATLEGKLAKASFMEQLSQAKMIGLLTENEIEIMNDLEYWQNQVLVVDEFS